MWPQGLFEGHWSNGHENAWEEKELLIIVLLIQYSLLTIYFTLWNKQSEHFVPLFQKDWEILLARKRKMSPRVRQPSLPSLSLQHFHWNIIDRIVLKYQAPATLPLWNHMGFDQHADEVWIFKNQQDWRLERSTFFLLTRINAFVHNSGCLPPFRISTKLPNEAKY